MFSNSLIVSYNEDYVGIRIKSDTYTEQTSPN